MSIRQASGRYAYPGQGSSQPVGDVSTLADPAVVQSLVSERLVK